MLGRHEVTLTEGGLLKIMIGVAAKNYTTGTNILEEALKFRKIVPHGISHLRAVLLVCATSYSSGVNELFPPNHQSFVFSTEKSEDNVSFEVIVVGLDSAPRRRAFFSLATKDVHTLDLIETILVTKSVDVEQPPADSGIVPKHLYL